MAVFYFRGNFQKMIEVNTDIVLQPITNKDCSTLFNLMQKIYSAAYSHFWKDSGQWYVNNVYSKENILKELLEENATYYFVLFKGEID